MESLIGFFESVPDGVRTGVLVVGLVFFWILEGALPRFDLGDDKPRHAALNLLLATLVVTVGLLLGLMVVEACELTTARHFGLLYLVELPLWLHVVLGVLLLDLIGAYLIHFIQHKVGWMWKFHLVHHSDTAVDVTTSLRQHPGETVFRIGFTALAVLVVGIPIGILVLYQSLSVLFAQVTHANLGLSPYLDRPLSWVFVSPNMHKVHHHYRQPFTDTNFGNIFSIWDRLFGTYAPATACPDLKYGVDSLPDGGEKLGLRRLLTTPFR
jgi:sterol desaturase/sphingolipid hydroxylase (fatty acid hydroxylase superfamily)